MAQEVPPGSTMQHSGSPEARLGTTARPPSDCERRTPAGASLPPIASPGIAGARDRLVATGIAGFERRPRRNCSLGSVVC